ncbi:HAD-IA family hydrolase [Ruficoccus sp. ZRK36]|uniref:HAD-IA family hydrolase n=1 Tax=Ruficoccus sp. ZRK36 TaxID=2866311 RepID=UPI001C735B58|nr:HAD-IA family hydrolase [Ruficoccus sp. ZRK36]QYY37385.1 HAD-IA family hydrolase [Ruficoccus sp. ZRK36]
MSIFENIRAITFDVAGTLLDPHPSVGETYAAALALFGHHADSTELQRRFVRAFKQVNAGPRGGILNREGWSQIVELTFEGLCPPETLPELFEELWLGYARPTSWRMLPGVHEILGLLRERGYRLGILSNNDERLLGLLKALELDVYFDAVILSSVVGAGKPRREMFAAAEQALGVAPEHLLHIGDTPHEDIAGALNAGWRVVQVGKKSAFVNERGEPTPGVPRMDGLPELAASLAE